MQTTHTRTDRGIHGEVTEIRGTNPARLVVTGLTLDCAFWATYVENGQIVQRTEPTCKRLDLLAAADNWVCN